MHKQHEYFVFFMRLFCEEHPDCKTNMDRKSVRERKFDH